jgi:hypothetical protein
LRPAAILRDYFDPASLRGKFLPESPSSEVIQKVQFENAQIKASDGHSAYQDYLVTSTRVFNSSNQLITTFNRLAPASGLTITKRWPSAPTS